jgi:hypothetical protein
VTELLRRGLRSIEAAEGVLCESLGWITGADALHSFADSGYSLG